MCELLSTLYYGYISLFCPEIWLPFLLKPAIAGQISPTLRPVYSGKCLGVSDIKSKFIDGSHHKYRCKYIWNIFICGIDGDSMKRLSLSRNLSEIKEEIFFGRVWSCSSARIQFWIALNMLDAPNRGLFWGKITAALFGDSVPFLNIIKLKFRD